MSGQLRVRAALLRKVLKTLVETRLAEAGRHVREGDEGSAEVRHQAAPVPKGGEMILLHHRERGSYGVRNNVSGRHSLKMQ